LPLYAAESSSLANHFPLGIATRWIRLAECDTLSPKVWMDAYLAAFARGHRLRLVSPDKDLRKYVGEGLDFHLLK
jgi:predicted nucleic acid-binding protein